MQTVLSIPELSAFVDEVFPQQAGRFEILDLAPGRVRVRMETREEDLRPGKVNPVIPEAVCMVAAQVIGNDAAITVGGQAGNFQLNVMLPMIANNLLQSIEILANSSRLLADDAIESFVVKQDRLKEALGRNPILVTALNSVIGYEAAAKIAKRAYAEGRPVMDVAKEMTKLSDAELKKLLDPTALTKGGIPSGS